MSGQKKRHALAISVAGSVFVSLSTSALSQAIDDAGGQVVRQERQRVEQLLRESPEAQLERGRPTVSGERPDTDIPDDGTTYFIRSISVNTPEFLPADVVAAIIAKYENRNLTLTDIRQIARAFDEAFVKAGFKAGFAVLPNQDLQSGALQVLLVEPRVDGIAISGLNRVKPAYVANRIPLKQGDPLDLTRLERNLNLINRTSRGGLQIEALLQPGGAFGTTKVDLAAREPAPFEMLAGIDNYGTESTGRVRPMTILRAYNVSGRDDPLQVGLSGADDSLSGFGSYSTPIVDFLRLNLSGSISESRIQGGDLADLGLATDSRFVMASLENPIFTTERWLMKGELGGEYQIANTETGPLLIKRRITEVFGQLYLNYYGDTGGMLSTLRYGGFEAHIEDNAETSTDWFSYLSASLFAYKRSGPFEVRFRAEGQWSPDESLPSAKQFSLGGPYSVRGYEASQFSGDSGFALGLEGRLDLFRPQTPKRINAITAVVFADGGGVFPYRADDTGSKREDFASSVGAGLELSAFQNRLAFFAGVAQPLDSVHEPIHGDDPRLLLSLSFTQPLY